jgi:predicted nuclease with TOPRIM domain
VDTLKTSEAKLNTQAEAHKAEVEDLQKKLAEINENFEVAKAKQEIIEMEKSRVQKILKNFGILKKNATKYPRNARRN